MGRRGRADVLAGGTGADCLLLPGATAHTYAHRLTFLRAGDGLNGTYTLTSATVYDAAIDLFTGDAGHEWYFHRPTGLTRDRFIDPEAGEEGDVI